MQQLKKEWLRIADSWYDAVCPDGSVVADESEARALVTALLRNGPANEEAQVVCHQVFRNALEMVCVSGACLFVCLSLVNHYLQAAFRVTGADGYPTKRAMQKLADLLPVTAKEAIEFAQAQEGVSEKAIAFLQEYLLEVMPAGEDTGVFIKKTLLLRACERFFRFTLDPECRFDS